MNNPISAPAQSYLLCAIVVGLAVLAVLFQLL